MNVKKEKKSAAHTKNDVYNFSYADCNNNLYPFRLNGNPQYIDILQKIPFGAFDYASDVYLNYSSAEKFFRTNISPEERGLLYTSSLEARPVTTAHFRNEWDDRRLYAERKLIGQLTVFSKIRFEPGECIGACSGEIVNSENKDKFSRTDIFHYLQIFSSYLITEPGPSCPLKTKKGTLVGDGILSRINSIFRYDQVRKWYESESNYEYNVCVAPVTFIAGKNRIVYLPCFFSVRRIMPGEELRVRYGFNDEKVNMVMTLR